MKKPWEYSYFNWLESVNNARVIIERHLQTQTGHNFNSTDFSNLCPSCFWRGKDESNDAYNGQKSACIVSIDGNFQHKRFNWVNSEGPKTATTAMFVECRQEAPSAIARTDVAGCGHSFTASDSAPKPKSMQRSDETGLMGVNCQHGQLLRYQNMFSGERTSVTANLLKAIVKECSPNTNFYLLYDIACIFSPSL